MPTNASIADPNAQNVARHAPSAPLRRTQRSARIANASYKRQRRNPAVTEITKVPDRGHSLIIDSGWREVADTALRFVRRFT